MITEEIKRIVITGGTESGKTTVFNAVINDFPTLITPVKEVATMLLSGGFPVPNRDLPWSQELQDLLQQAIFGVQKPLESACLKWAAYTQAKATIADRGVMDGAIYLSGGVKEFCRIFSINEQQELNRYDLVVHLVTRATVEPHLFGNREGNDCRFEITAARALEIDQAALAAWSGHHNRVIISCGEGIVGKIAGTINAIKRLLMI